MTVPLPPAHRFHAAAFVENFGLKELAAAYPGARRTPHELAFDTADGGRVYLYPFGAAVFVDLTEASREAELARLRTAPKAAAAAPSGAPIVHEELTVRVRPGARPDVINGELVIDEITAERASIIALTIAQSASMEYYEGIVHQMFGRTDTVVDQLERTGTMPLTTRPLHRFIGAAIGTRNEVISILHLLDKPDEAWDDPGADKIYEELRAEFDLVDRHQALELKLRSVQEALELVLDVARDRRLVLLEASIVLLIVFEILLSFVRH